MNRWLGGLALLALLLAAPAGAGATVATETAATPVASPLRTVSVQGSGHEPIASEADQASAIGAYRQSLTGALADAQAKAQLLATDAGASLGDVQSIAEQEGYIECPDEVEYTGVRPDFPEGGFGGPTPLASTVAARSNGAGAGTPVRHKAKPQHKHASKRPRRTAKKAAAATCTLTASVAVSYELS